MCTNKRWEKISNGSWTHSISPFGSKLLDIRTANSFLESFEVSIEEGNFPKLYVQIVSPLNLIIALITGSITLSSLSLSLLFRNFHSSCYMFVTGHTYDEFGSYSEQLISILLWHYNGNRYHPCNIDCLFSGDSFASSCAIAKLLM